MIKHILYDWCGYNEKIFLFFNNMFGQKYLDHFMIYADDIGGHHNFIYHFSFLIAMSAYFIYRKRHDKLQLEAETLKWLEIMTTLVVSLFFTYAIIYELKNIFAVSRPYCTATLGAVHTIPYVIDPIPCNHSFPSGHMSFATVLIVALWPIMPKILRILSSSFMVYIGISRMAAGAHYPADLFWGFFICFPCTIATRKLVRFCLTRYYNVYRHLLPWLE